MFDVSRMVPLEPASLSEGTEYGLAPYRNQVAGDAVFDVSTPGDAILMDPAYGLIYDGALVRSTGLYGRASELPPMPGDALANLGFLRVPFRRVPRRRVASRRELDAIVGGLDDRGRVEKYWRGQSREHLLTRDPATTWLLYGEPQAVEPSLLTSAGREAMAWEAILPIWSPIVRAHLDSVPTLSDLRDGLYRSYALRAFLLALGQHYGLPTSGLDVTTQLRVGLFFALHEFRREGDNVVCHRKEAGSGDSVLYCLIADPDVAVDYDELVPPLATAARPRAQTARFLATAWGQAPNACARMIFCAFYLAPGVDWGDDIPDCGEMFPDNDPFAEWLNCVGGFDLPPGAQELLSRYSSVISADSV